MRRRLDTVSLAALSFAAATCASAPTPPVQTAKTVSAVVLVNHCASLGATNARRAQQEMNQLVEGCSAYTGGTVRFTATLLPGGAIQFEPGPDAAAAIPVCVLSRPLKHTVHLSKSCSLDIALEVTSIALPRGP